MTKNQWTTLHETGDDLAVTNQRRRIERTVRHTDGHKVRVSVLMDSSYAGQSSLTAEVWSGTEWKNVVRILGTDPAITTDAESMYSRDVEAKRAYLDHIADELLNRAIAVLA